MHINTIPCRFPGRRDGTSRTYTHTHARARARAHTHTHTHTHHKNTCARANVRYNLPICAARTHALRSTYLHPPLCIFYIRGRAARVAAKGMKKGFFRVAHNVRLLSVGVPLIRKTRVLEKKKIERRLLPSSISARWRESSDRQRSGGDPTCDRSACGRLRGDSRISGVLVCVTSDFFRERNKK